MHVEIVTKNVDKDGAIRKWIRKKMDVSMDRVRKRVAQITLRLEDGTRAAHGLDGVCRIDVDLRPRGHIHVSSSGESILDCAQQAIQKMEHAVKHEIDRNQSAANIRHRRTKREFIESLRAHN